MLFSIPFLLFMPIPQVRTGSLLTGTYDPNSTALINERRDIKEIDVLRQIINQETLIRLAVVKDVKAAVDDVSSVKQSVASTETMVCSLQQTLNTLKGQVDSLILDTTLAQKVETLQRQVYTLGQDKNLEQKVETLERQDCKDHYLQGQTQSGVYIISPFGNESQIDVYCDMVTEGGGWTAIQKRMSGSESFDRTWAEYKNGFGNANDSYWIGNDAIYQLTKGRNSSLYVSITIKNGTTFYELYQQFSINDEADTYSLFLGGPATGTLGDSMLDSRVSVADLSGMYFSTPDRDNDRYSVYNCAALHRGGWWFNDCHLAFLNGPWSPADWYDPWYPTVWDRSSIRETMMFIKSH